MVLDLTFCHETPLNAAIDVDNKLKVCSPVPFVFIILSCWMSSSNNIIWIFVSFVGLIAIVSGNRLNFFDKYQFSHLKIFVSTLIRTTFFSIISILLMSL